MRNISRDSITILSLIDRLQRQGVGMRGWFQIDVVSHFRVSKPFENTAPTESSNQNERFRFCKREESFK